MYHDLALGQPDLTSSFNIRLRKQMFVSQGFLVKFLELSLIKNENVYVYFHSKNVSKHTLAYPNV